MKLKLKHEGVIRDDRGRLRGTVYAVDAHNNDDPLGFEHYGNLSNVQEQRRIERGLIERLGVTREEARSAINETLQEMRQKATVQNSATSSGASINAGSELYQSTDAGLIWHKVTGNGILPVRLTNFNAQIVAQTLEDNGVEFRRVFEVEAMVRGCKHNLSIPASEFTGMTWVAERLGATAIVYAGFTVKDNARAAIQDLSGGVPERRVYTHLGWRKIGAQWAYLHAGGGLGFAGPLSDVEVSLPDSLKLFMLPDPPTGDVLKEAVRASLKVLDLAADSVTVPCYASLFRAVLGGSDFSTHICGETGAFKSALAALLEQHFGAAMDARHLPGSWSSTGNALEGLAFTAKDVLLVVDDFSPRGSTFDVQRYHREADRLFRAQGNRAGRQRMRPDASLRAVMSPRGLILSTGEDIPQGQSLQARILVLVLAKRGPGAVDVEKLTQCQKDASMGLYVRAMAAFIRWLAGRYEEIQTCLVEEEAMLRLEAYQDGQHRRTPDIVAQLGVGLRYWFQFSQETGAITDIEADALWKRCWSALGEAAASQAEQQGRSDPARRFLELLDARIASGHAHVANNEGWQPSKPVRWGWRLFEGGAGENSWEEWRPQGTRLGWVEGDDLYLDSNAAFAEAQKLSREQGESLTVTLLTLKRRLKEQGLLASTERYISQGRNVERFEVRHTLQGKRRAVLHIRSESMSSGSEPGEPTIGDVSKNWLDDAHQNGSRRDTDSQAVRHSSEPHSQDALGSNATDGSHGSHFIDDNSANRDKTDDILEV